MSIQAKETFVDLFSLGATFPITDLVIFSRELFLDPYKNDSFICTLLFQNWKASFLKSIITLSNYDGVTNHPTLKGARGMF